MSCDIRKYQSMDLGGEYSDDLTLTAFVGGEYGHSIQFTIGMHYCALSEKALVDLIDTINKRFNCEEGYSATGHERENILFKD